MRLIFNMALLSTLSFGVTAKTPTPIPQGFVAVANECKVPPVALYGIALTETETRMQNGTTTPWHYAINWKGKSFYFYNREEMYRYAQSLLARGNEVFDVGIMQLNWKWQKHRGYSLWELTDIQTNVRVACDILKEGYAAKGNWVDAAGFYHNPSKKVYSDRYKAIFKRKIARLGHGI